MVAEGSRADILKTRNGRSSLARERRQYEEAWFFAAGGEVGVDDNMDAVGDQR